MNTSTDPALSVPSSSPDLAPGGVFALRFDAALARLLPSPDERRLDATWSAVQDRVLELTLRPAKRVRPWLVFAGHALGGGPSTPPEALWSFAAGVEALHTFMLIHDDVADRSSLRRGGPSLHLSLETHGPGADLAVVAGDHLFARAIELMLGSGLPGAAGATRFYLEICRHTAVGQFLDLSLPHRPLSELTPFDALKVAHLKTAKYSFAAPLACGALLAGAPQELVSALERAGRLAGLAFQLRDDLIGLEGDMAVAGKPCGDLAEGKRTFPLLLSYRRATEDERAILDALGPGASRGLVGRAAEIVRRHGGPRITERAIARATRAARRVLASVPAPRSALASFLAVLDGLARRAA